MARDQSARGLGAKGSQFAVASGFRQVSSPIVAVAIGDSITFADTANAYWNYVTWLSGGKIIFRTQRGIPGNTSAQITSRLLDEALCYPGVRLAFCMQGTNDIGTGVAASVTQQNDTAFIKACQGVGVTPVLMGLPPRSDNSTFALTTLTINAQKRALAASLGAIFIDVLPAVGSTTTGQYLSASYTSDNLHPSQIGTRLIAQAIIAQLASQLPFYSSVTAPIASDTGNPVANPLMETDNGAGKANSWTFFGTTTGKTISLVTDSETKGRWQRISWTTGATAGEAFLNQSVSVAQFRGCRVAFVGRMRTTGLEAGGGSMEAKVLSVTDAPNIAPFIATAVDGDGVFYAEGIIPASATTATVQFGYTASASVPGPVTVDIAEIAVIAVRGERGLIGTRAQRSLRPVKSVTAAYTATLDDDVILVDATSAAVTVTLPPAGLNPYINSPFSAASYGLQLPAPGLGFTVIKTDATANAVTIAAAGSDTINGAATQNTTTQYASLKPLSVGGGKWLLA